MKVKFFRILVSIMLIALCGCNGVKTNQNMDEVLEVNIVDDMSSLDVANKEFYIMRVKDDYIEIANGYPIVYLEESGKYPNLEDGQIAYVKADVTIYEGGEAGYMGNSFIRKLQEYRIIDSTEIDELFDFQDVEENNFTFDQRILKYNDSQKSLEYLIVLHRSYVEVYSDCQNVYEYEFQDMDSPLEGFWNFINVN